MAYNNMDALNTILSLKKKYEYGNDADKKYAENAAKQYYAALDNQPQIKQFLQNSNYETAKKYVDKINNTQGRVKIRDFVNEKGKDYGINANDVLKYDEATGQVSFGSKNLGLPIAEYDGITYWDADKLENEWNDFVKNSGLKKNTGVDNTLYNSSINKSEGAVDKYSGELTGDRENEIMYYQKLLNDLMSNDVANSKDYSEAFDKVMRNYGFKAEDAKDNQLASDSGDNGGNIDSFASANAQRQKNATLAQGAQLAHQIGLDTYNARINAISNILSNYGVTTSNLRNDRAKETELYGNIGQQAFDNEQTAKNNDVSRKRIIAGVIGYTPKEWTDSQNSMFLNDDGTIKSEFLTEQFDNNGGFEAIIQQARASDDKELEKQAKIARTKKIFGNMAKYGQYLDNDIMVNEPKVTEERRQAEASDKLARDLASAEQDAQLKLLDKETDNQIRLANETASKPSLTKSEVLQALKNGEASQSVIDAYNIHYGTAYTTDNPPPVYSNSKGNNPISPGNEDVKIVTIGKIDDERIKTCGVDKYGLKMIKGLQKKASELGGMLTTEELKEFVINNSNAYETNLDQIKNVYNYLGADVKDLEDVKDSGFWFWDWNKGVKEEKK